MVIEIVKLFFSLQITLRTTNLELCEGGLQLEKFNTGTNFRKLLAFLFMICAVAGPALADDAPKKAFDVRSQFSSICGFCHEDSGRRAGKGPQLMNSERSDQYLFDRIKKGLPGRMAAFGSAFNDDQIGQIVKFIRNLKPDVEPQNP
jgi:mono/diheme cytochrome c family protein